MIWDDMGLYGMIWSCPARKMAVAQQWMVFVNGKIHLQMDDDRGYPYDLGNPHTMGY